MISESEREIPRSGDEENRVRCSSRKSTERPPQVGQLMSGTPNDSSDWGPCPQGELTRVAGRLQRQRSLRRVARVAAITTVTLVALAGIVVLFVPEATGWLFHPGEFHYGGISCSEIQRLLPELKAGTLDEKTMARVRVHLDKCPHCQTFSRVLRDRPVQTGALSGGLSPVPAVCQQPFVLMNSFRRAK